MPFRAPGTAAAQAVATCRILALRTNFQPFGTGNVLQAVHNGIALDLRERQHIGNLSKAIGQEPATE
jgi:hypothetical protein